MQYTNASFQTILGRNEVLRVRNGVIEFTAAEARERFAAAVAAAQRIADGADQDAVADFVVARPNGLPRYIVSVRPIPNRFRQKLESEASTMIFVRDPTGHRAAGLHLLRDAFGFTDAEASLARALQEGMTPGDYARTHAVSVNTVYTHLRRVKEKTGCHRMPELIRRLNDLQGSVGAG